MRFEIYLDRLFVEYFVWNCFLLMITNRRFWSSSGAARILLGGGVGAGISCLAYVVPMPFGTRILMEAAGLLSMIRITFAVSTFRNYGRVLRQYLKYALLYGSLMILLERYFCYIGVVPDPFEAFLLSCLMIGTSWLLFTEIERRKVPEQVGRATMICGKRKMVVRALMDSGNSLTEPISGKPVCVLDSEISEYFWSGEALFRVIPYHCVGVEHGVLKGYLLPELRVELDGPVKVMREVWVAAGPKKAGKEWKNAMLLLSPRLFV